ncbi:hypothetical protein [Pseudochryseolinea flava]|nr:hypothetical protein [Pseudochryseolinea flava]
MKAKRTMLDYCQAILEKMSFSEKLFVKEYRKSLQWLSNAEAILLNQWVYRTFEPALVRQLHS